jgi:gliding motility-associated-like protein
MNYSTTVPHVTTGIQVTPTAQDATATITVNGVTTASGTPSAVIPLNVGDNVITTSVTAQDGVTVKDYIITVTRDPSTNANLGNLTVSPGVLSPSFSTSTTAYTASVGSASSIIVTATAADAGTIRINGTSVASGSPSGSIPLSNGDNNIAIVITAQDGITTKTYTLTVTVTIITPPSIIYPSPNIYTASTAIPALSPTNTGSPVPATIYSSTSTFAGSGIAGNANGTGLAATFTGPRDMATDAAGNIYVVDYTANIIRKITPAGVVTTFAGSGAAGSTNGTGIAATFNHPAGIAVDAASNVYIADSGNNLIRKITPAGVVTTFAGSGAAGTVNGAGTVARFNNPHGMTIDAAGNLYVADFTGNTVRKITPAAVVSTLAGGGTAGNANGTGVAATFSGPTGLTADNAGNIYVTDYTNNLIRKINTAAIVTTFAGSGTAASTDGTGTAASFKSPYAITIDRQGNVYVAEASNKIRMLTPAAVTITLAGSGTAGGTNGTGIAARFNDPRGVTFSNGNLYVSDYAGHQIRKIVLTGYISPALPAGLSMNVTTGIITGTPTTPKVAANYTVTAWNGGGSGSFTINILVKPTLAAPNISYTSPQTYTAGTAITALSPANSGGAVPATVYSAVSTLAGSGAAGSANGTGAAATFNGLRDMATDAAGNIYAADYTANVIRKITPAGVVTTFAGSGTAGSANGTGTAASFNKPAGVVVDAAGNVYISDSGNNLIRMITPTGVVTTFAGSGVAGTSNGTGIAARFNNPHGLTIDGDGNLYVADFAGNDIRKITPATVVTTLAGSGTAGNANGTGAAATFNGPSGLAADPSGNIYVADYSNNLIRKITPAGVVTTSAGSGTAGSTNGTGTGASFKSPYSITADWQGNVYVAEASNKIRIISPAAAVTTLAGSGTAGSTNGTGTAATFNDPKGVALSSGNLYVADYAGHQVRKVIITGYIITPALPAGLSFAATTGIITGTPTAATAAANYTVTAWNTSGGGAAVINIAVKAMGGKALAQPEIPIEDPIAGAPVVKQGVSPNGDGIDDVLVINNIEKYPDNKITIMNSAGSTVYQASGYNNNSVAFDGHSNKTNAMQKPGTYFYRLEYKDGTQTKYTTGFILLKY